LQKLCEFIENQQAELPVSCSTWHTNPLSAPTGPVVRSLAFPYSLGTVLVDTSLPTVAADPVRTTCHRENNATLLSTDISNK